MIKPITQAQRRVLILADRCAGGYGASRGFPIVASDMAYAPIRRMIRRGLLTLNGTSRYGARLYVVSDAGRRALEASHG